MFCLALLLKYFGTMLIKNNSGAVPSPKKDINKALSPIEFAASEPTNATYTKPQGKRPFTIPKSKKLLLVLALKKGLNVLVIFLVIFLNGGKEMFWLKKTNKKSNIPIAIVK